MPRPRSPLRERSDIFEAPQKPILRMIHPKESAFFNRQA
jgi:hypothetical protein